jgi:hypothetical protein
MENSEHIEIKFQRSPNRKKKAKFDSRYTTPLSPSFLLDFEQNWIAMVRNKLHLDGSLFMCFRTSHIFNYFLLPFLFDLLQGSHSLKRADSGGNGKDAGGGGGGSQVRVDSFFVQNTFRVARYKHELT